MKIIGALTRFTRQRCFLEPTWKRMENIGGPGNFTWLTDWARIPPHAEDPPGRDTLPEMLRKTPAAKEAPVLITGWQTAQITAEVLDAMPKLKLIAHSAGSVAHIDIDAWKRNITVTNVMPMMGYGVAEFSLHFIMHGLRRMSAHVRPELWNSSPFYSPDKHVGTMIRRKTIGLVGFGIIGRQTLDLLRPFGCTVLVYDPYVSAADIQKAGAAKVELDDLMARSDAVSLHAPGTIANKNTINEQKLRLLKPGAVLANTARGILIDHDALARVCSEGKIFAILDVTYPEPLPPDHPLRKLDNVVLTGHVAGPTADAYPEMGEVTLDEVERFVKGQPVQWIVTESQYMNQSRTT